ncbi:putative rmlC-like cupin domain superfamily, ureidoglycolate lyase domain superfamily [Arabidopsis thaliana]|nr:RmlC-like cupin domain superfamily [Arabidopsis thaliana x Arabidopsis arenosa]
MLRTEYRPHPINNGTSPRIPKRQKGPLFSLFFHVKHILLKLTRKPRYFWCFLTESRLEENFRKTPKSSYANSYLHFHFPCGDGESSSVPTMAKSPVEVKLIPIEATPENFAEYGQVIEASRDGAGFGPNDAQLDLSRGIPRFYIMRIRDTPFDFSVLTHHASVTQCLGSIGGHVWYLGVAKPTLIEDGDDGKMVDKLKSRSGHLYAPPAVEEIRIFRVSGPKFIKLNHGTWHVGPLFSDSYMDFYNLELSNTNAVDRTTYDFIKNKGVTIRVDPNDVDTSSS